MRSILIFFFFIVSYSSVQAQFNFKAGFIYGIFNNAFENDIYKRYDAANTWQDDPFEKIYSTPGMLLGICQKTNLVNIGANMSAKFQRLQSKGTPTGSTSEVTRDFFYKLSSYSLEADFPIGNFSFGASIDGNNYKINTRSSNDNERRTIMRDFALGSHFHIGWKLPGGDNISYSIRPFFQTTWTPVNFFALEQELFLYTEGIESDFDSRFSQFGITFIFFNGPQ